MIECKHMIEIMWFCQSFEHEHMEVAVKVRVDERDRRLPSVVASPYPSTSPLQVQHSPAVPAVSFDTARNVAILN